MALLSLEEEYFQLPRQIDWLSSHHTLFLRNNFHRINTRINDWSPNKVMHKLCLLSNNTTEIFLNNLEGNLMQLLLALSSDEPLDVSISFTHLKRMNGMLVIFEEEPGESVTIDAFNYSVRQFKNWLKRVYLIDARNHFSSQQKENLVMNLIDPAHYSREGRESQGLANLVITCSLTLHIKPSAVFNIGTPFFSKFTVSIDYFPNAGPPVPEERDE